MTFNQELFIFVKDFLEKLLGLLIQMQLKPQSGYGKTEIIWEQGRIAYISQTDTYKIK